MGLVISSGLMLVVAGQIQISDDFNKPDQEMIDLFYGDVSIIF